ncbi:MAG: hypothetical protein ABIJ97_14270 [Bacteroidota bacterium]
MNKLNFIHEWVQPEDAKGDELRFTWAKLSIQSEDEVLTRIFDKRLRTVSDSIYLPLYPLAEWLMYNYWYLIYEHFTSGKHTYIEYDIRHNLKFAQEGYSLPDIHIRPLGNIVRLTWKPIKYSFRNVEFIGHGEINVDVDDFKQSVFDFINIVITRLEDSGISDTVLQKEWEAFSSLENDEIKFCEAASALGVDPFNVDNKLQKLIIQSSKSIPSNILMDFFGIASNKNFKNDLEQTLNAIKLQEQNDSKLESIIKLREKITNSHRSQIHPWNQGYEAAKELRNLLGVNGKPLSNIDDLGSILKIKNKDINSITIRTDIPETLCAISGSNNIESPCFIMNKSDEVSNVFTICRAFYNYFYSDYQTPSMITKTRSTIQKTNRAFAAEFIFPAETLRKIIDNQHITSDDVQNIASKYNISAYLIEHQIENNNIALIERD